MRKILFLAFIIAATAPLTFGQSDDYNKVEFYGGYSHNRVDTGIDDNSVDPDIRDIFDETTGFHGFNTSITRNFHRYVGAKFDFAGHYRNDTFSVPGLTPGTTVNAEVDQRVYNFLGGVQFKDNSKEAKFKPFAHVLAGGAHQSATLTATGLGPVIGTTSDSLTVDDTSFAMAFGGGIDLRVHPRVDLRLIQVDYNPVFMGDQNFGGTTVVNGGTQHNFRIGVGVVIH